MLNSAINSNQNTNINVINGAKNKFVSGQKNSKHTQQTKKTVLKEEFFALTDGELEALVLAKLLAWSLAIGDRRKQNFFWEEEERRRGVEIETFEHGWIYKKAAELADDLGLGTEEKVEKRVRRRLIALRKKGYIFERNNPEHKWDKTKQYRLNLIKIIDDLQDLGYKLTDYQAPKSLFISKRQSVPSKRQSVPSKRQNVPAIPEQTTSSTTFSNLDTTTYTHDAALDEKPSSCSGDTLIFDGALENTPQAEKIAIERSLKGVEDAQLILDEVNTAVANNAVKKSRMALLKALIHRKAKGQFHPTSKLSEQRAKVKAQSTLGNAISQCLLCDDNGILTLMTPQGTTTTTRCSHNAEEIQSIAKERGFEVIPHKKA